MTKITTPTGFECEIDKSIIEDDWEYVEALDAVMSGTPGAMVRLAKTLLSADDYKALKKHCEKDGRTSSAQMQDELIEIVKAASKKS